MSRLKHWSTLFVFLAILIATNLLGLLLLLFGPEQYWKYTYYFSGMTLPDVTYGDMNQIILVTMLSILSLVAGYAASLFAAKKIKLAKPLFPLPEKNLWAPVSNVLFWCAALYCLANIFSVIDLADITAWLNYNRFIEIRYLLMNSFSFWFHVVIYMLLPLFIGLTIPHEIKNKQYLLTAVKICVYAFANVYIFQKRPFITSMLFLSLIIAVYFAANSKKTIPLPKLAVWCGAVIVAAYTIYIGSIYVNTIDNSAISIIATEKVLLPPSVNNTLPSEPSNIPDVRHDIYRSYELESEVISSSAFIRINAQAFIGMINRTAFSSIVYPILFPDRIPYYPFDYGRGSGNDENLMAWNIMNPQNPGEGAFSSPFYITLYSQGGLPVSIIGSLVVGFMMGFFWNLLLAGGRVTLPGSVFGGLVFLESITVALASPRDSLMSSYGVVYPVFVFLALYLFIWGVGRIFGSFRKGAAGKVCMLVTSNVFDDPRVRREAQSAMDEGISVRVIGRGEKARDMAIELPFDVKLVNIIKPKRFGVLGKIIERIYFGIHLFLEAVAYRPDIIHCNDFDTLPFGYAASLVTNSGLVYDSHELWSENLSVAKSWLGKRLVKGIERHITKQCDLVICVSNAAADWMRQSYDLDNVVVVTNTPCKFTGSLPDKNPGFELITHGRFAPDRGYEEVARCARLLEKDGVTVSLRGYGEMQDAINKIVAEENRPNLRMLPKVDAFELIEAIASAHVAAVLTKPVTVSFNLTVSNKLFESLAAGLPVILSDVAEHRLLNEKYGFGIIIGEVSENALAEAVRRLKNDSRLYKRMRENALRAARELCWENESKKLIGCYRDIIGIQAVPEFSVQ